MPYTVLFLCTGNSARSILAEVLLNHLGHDQFQAFSAGSSPKGTVHPITLELCQRLGVDTTQLKSKSIDEVVGQMPSEPDFVITLCDNAANEPCPIYLSKAFKAHWPFPDPALPEAGSQQSYEAFAQVFNDIKKCIEQFIQIPFATRGPEIIKEHITKDNLLLKSK